eukprot:GHUV01012398.1.p2 GENE.GHUV01012398.1~~GHUV01012398.1.p2  ORF type:complete len:161 (+),score=21.40 GHUV01012398.1:2070-2552(+)
MHQHYSTPINTGSCIPAVLFPTNLLSNPEPKLRISNPVLCISGNTTVVSTTMTRLLYHNTISTLQQLALASTASQTLHTTTTSWYLPVDEIHSSHAPHSEVRQMRQVWHELHEVDLGVCQERQPRQPRNAHHIIVQDAVLAGNEAEVYYVRLQQQKVAPR